MGLGPRLEVRALETILAHRADLPNNCFLSLNVDPNYLVEPGVRDVFAQAGDLTGLVVELTEHHRWYWDAFEPTLRFLRRNGAQLAIDDTGAGYSGLQQILLLRPAILKLDRSLIEGIDADEARVALVEMISVFAGRIDAAVLAEGVETLGEALRLLDLGVPLAQGFLFGRPQPPWADIDPGVEARLARFSAGSQGQLHRLLERATAIRQGEPADVVLDTNETWYAVVDERQRPIGVVDACAGTSGRVVETVVVDVHSTPQEVARRLAATTSDLTAPIVVTDDRGRYLGLIPLRRLLADLGS
jgi:EAL domain-containing protein (putative c-di-GMP-specific phosphodiesterase class I)